MSAIDRRELCVSPMDRLRGFPIDCKDWRLLSYNSENCSGRLLV